MKDEVSEYKNELIKSKTLEEELRRDAERVCVEHE